MSIFRYIAAYLAVLLVIEIIVFCVWMLLLKKNTELINKYWIGVFGKKDIANLSKGQSFLVQVIYVTRMSIVFFLIIEAFSILIKST